MSSSSLLDKLYDTCFLIDEAEDKTKHETDYLAFVTGAKTLGTEEGKVRKFSGQMMIKYFPLYPAQQEEALDALFELCQDEDVEIRKGVVKELPQLCKCSAGLADKIADVLTQLLQTDDAVELNFVQKALMDLLEKYPKVTLTQIFANIMNSDEEIIRDRAVRFIAAKLKMLKPSVLTKELEEMVYAESKKVMQDVTGEEFVLFMYTLQNLPHLQTLSGRKQLLQLIELQSDMDKPFDATEPERVDQVCQCFKQAIPYLSKNVSGSKMVEFMLTKVMPTVDQITGDGSALARLELYRVLAELTQHCSDLEVNDEKLQPVYDKLMSLLPLPPSEAGLDASVSTNGASVEDDPKVEFSEVEALLTALHNLAKRHPEFFSAAEKVEALKEFKKRLQYMARVIQVYSTKLRSLLNKLDRLQLAKEENKIKLLGLKTTANISLLLKDFLHTNPSYKATVHPSWKQPASGGAAVAVKRKSIGEDEGEKASPPKTARKTITVEREPFQPNKGKWSDKVSKFEERSAEWQPNAGRLTGGGGGRGMRRGGGWRGGRGRGGRGRMY